MTRRGRRNMELALASSIGTGDGSHFTGRRR